LGSKAAYTYKTKQICNNDGHIWRIEGRRQLQLPLISTVPIVIAEAVMAPIKYEELNRDVIMALSLGYESSPIMADAAIIHITMPNPRIIRAMMYIATKDLLEPCKGILC
jgi:hypothetical protein